MKLLIAMMFILGMACHAFDGNIRIDIDAMRNDIPLEKANASPGLKWFYTHAWPNYLNLEKHNNLVFEGTAPLSEEWQKFEFEFTPGKSEELKLYARGVYTLDDSKTAWVAYTGFKESGTELSNGDFSQIKNGVPEGWLINPGLFDTSAKPPLIYGAFGAFGVKTLKVTADKRVRISFMARKGKETDWNELPVRFDNKAIETSLVKLVKFKLDKIEFLKTNSISNLHKPDANYESDLKRLGLISCKIGDINDKIISCVPLKAGAVMLPFKQDLSIYDTVKVTITPLSGSFKAADFGVAINQDKQYYPGKLENISEIIINKPVELLFDISQTARNNPQYFRFYFSRTGDKIDEEEKDPSCFWFFSDILTFPPLFDKGLTAKNITEKSPDKNFKFGRPTPEPRFVGNPTPSGKGNVTKKSVPVELLEDYGVDRTASVRFGFPLPEGGLCDIKKMQVLNPEGKPVPFQTAGTAFWPDKSLKWVLLQFDAPLKANEKAIYQVVFGENVDEAEKGDTLILADNGDIISVDTGKLQATIDRNKFNLVKDVKIKSGRKWIDAGGFAVNGLELRDENGRLFSSAMIDPESVEIEEQGPERIVLRVRGKYGSTDKDATNMSYEVRLSFARGSEKVGIAVSTTNTNLENEFTDIDSLSCAFVPASPIQGGKVLLDAQNLQTMRQGPCQTEEIVLNPNSQTRLFQEDEQILSGAKGHENSRLTGAVEVDTATGPVRAVLKDCWQRWPKAFSVNKKELVFELLPKQPSRNFYRNLPYYLLFPFCEGKYRLKWGVSFTENIDLDFGSMKSLAEADAETNLPVVAAIQRDWYYQTKVLPGATPGDDRQFDVWDDAVARWFNEHMEFKKTHHPYGFLNYGDWFGERGGTNWGNNEYDIAHGLFMDYIRTGNRDHYRWAVRAAQHDADVDTVHAYPDPYYVGGDITHSFCHNAGCLLGRKLTLTLSNPYSGNALASNGHTWLRGMVDSWLLAGNARTQESALTLGEHIVWNPPLDTKNFGVYLRAQGYPLIALAALYDVNHDPMYKEAAEKIVELVIGQQSFDKGGAWYHKVWGVGDMPVQCCLQVGILTQGMSDYYKMTGNPEAKKSIIASSAWLAESWHEKANGWPMVATWDGKAQGREPGCSDQNMLEAPPLAYAALLGGNSKWYDIAKMTMEQVPTKEMPSYGKPFSQMIMFAPELISGIYEWQQK